MIAGNELVVLTFLLLFVGAFAGFIGGLFGIGGGVVIVPALYTVFGIVGVPDTERIKLAVGTSLATIIVTSIRSVRAHMSHGAVELSLLWQWAPWIASGAVGGALLARYVEANMMTLVFAIGIMGLAIQKAFSPQHIDKKERPEPAIEHGILPVILGASIGMISSLMGIGGGVLGVIVLTYFGRSIHQAIATASGFGMAIAIPGTLGFIYSGWHAPIALPYSFGYVSAPAFIAIAVMSFMTAPIGANMAHRLDKQTLNRVFAVYMAITGILLMLDTLK
ncbi:MAG: sulfite exporter TauE/SafE family protein [bacterium]